MADQLGCREVQVGSKIKELDVAIGNLSATNDRLIERLQSISRDIKETDSPENAKCPTPVTRLVPLAETLNDFLNRVLMVTRNTDSIISRLEI